MFLMDSGGLYEGGYATDLTRTFLIGDKATQKQKEIFTYVLKGAIAGMSAKIPKDTVGAQVDAMVRAPIWAGGYNFAHGTGHGVGIAVHEAPPSVSSKSQLRFYEGQVFSIEPGIYIENFGGVRIENLCTVLEDPKDKDFWRVMPLTYSPLDKNLIEEKLLTPSEKKFLKWYDKGFRRPESMLYLDFLD